MMALRVAAGRRCSGASLMIEAPNASATISPASAGKISHGTSIDGGEEQPVAVQPVVGPFLIGAEIGHRRFDFDNDDLAVAAERHQVGAPARRQRQFGDHAITERMQIARGAARNG